MHVAVAIVGFRNADDIARCLAWLQRSVHTDFEVIVCENGGLDAFERLQASVAGALPGGQPVRIVAAENPGFAGGVNICLAQTPKADAWWVLNPDTCPDPEALAALVMRLEEGCDGVGCTLRLPNGTIQSHGGLWRRTLARAVSIGHGSAWSAPVDAKAIERAQTYLNGASMLISRRFLHAAGPMREDYFLYCEEIEWCLRATRRGMRIGYAPDAYVLHHQGTTTGNVPALSSRPRAPVYLNERNRILLTRDCDRSLLPLVILNTFVLLFIKYGRRGAWKQWRYGVAGWWAGLLNERGPPRWLKG